MLHSRASIIQPKVGFPLGGLAGTPDTLSGSMWASRLTDQGSNAWATGPKEA